MESDNNKKTEKFTKKNSDDYIKSIKQDDSFQILTFAFNNLKSKYDFDASEILSLIEEERKGKEILLPISIFHNNELSCLETIVKCLKEDFNLRFHEIALLLNRNDRTIWTTYNIACRKRKEKLPVKESEFLVPIAILGDRKFSVLELIVSHLKDKYNLRYCQIASLLNRDERNVWSVYNKALKKKNE